VLGINAGVVNINAAAVNGAGGVGAAAAGGGRGLVGSLARGGALIGGVALLANANGSNAPGVAGNLAGGALTGFGVAGPVGAVGGLGIGMAKSVAENQSAQNSKLAEGLGRTTDVYLRQSPPIKDLQNSLQAVERGIRDIESNPLNVLVQGSALDELRAMKEKIQGQIADRQKQDALAAARDRPMLEAVRQTDTAISAHSRAVDEQKRTTADGTTRTVSTLRQVESATRQTSGTIAAALRNAEAAIVSAIRASRPIVNATTVNKTSTIIQRYGRPGGSREHL
jgi:hypothetical protein